MSQLKQYHGTIETPILNARKLANHFIANVIHYKIIVLNNYSLKINVFICFINSDIII